VGREKGDVFWGENEIYISRLKRKGEAVSRSTESVKKFPSVKTMLSTGKKNPVLRGGGERLPPGNP